MVKLKNYKKTIVLIIMISLFFMFSGTIVRTNNSTNINDLKKWKQTLIYKGTGTKDDPYLIENAIQLSNVRNYCSNKDVHFKQTKDINVGGIAPIGDLKNPFQGTYDGDYYELTGIEINSSSNVGLFGVSDGVLKNIVIDEGSIHGNKNVGAVAGYNKGKIQNCTNKAVVTADSINCGGIVGYNEKGVGKIEACINIGEVKAMQLAGGIVGYNCGEVLNAYNSGVINASIYAEGGIAGVSGDYQSKLMATVKNCINTGKVNEDAVDYGAIIGDNSGKVENAVWNDSTLSVCGSNIDGTVVNVAYASNLAEKTLYKNWKEFGKDWVFPGNNQMPQIRHIKHFDDLFGGGKGTKDEPYLIKTAQQFLNINQTVGEGNCLYFEQFNDISFKNIEFMPIGSDNEMFTGFYDGAYTCYRDPNDSTKNKKKGFAIYDVNFSKIDTDNVGLFGACSSGYTDEEPSGGLIQNVVLKSGNIKGRDNVGGIVGENFGEVKNCSNYATIEAYGNSCGGIVGVNSDFGFEHFFGKIQFCSNYGSVSANTSEARFNIGAGGIVGENHDVIENVYNFGNIEIGSNGTRVGGIAGINGTEEYNFAKIQNSYNCGMVLGSEHGAIVGDNENGSIINALWNINMPASYQSLGNITNAREADDLTDTTLYSGWDNFDENWVFQDITKAPTLKFENVNYLEIAGKEVIDIGEQSVYNVQAFPTYALNKNFKLAIKSGQNCSLTYDSNNKNWTLNTEKSSKYGSVIVLEATNYPQQSNPLLEIKNEYTVCRIKTRTNFRYNISRANIF